VPHHRIVLSLFVATSLAVTDCMASIGAQTSADTIPLVRAVVEIIVHEARRAGDHQGPFVLIDADSSAWSRALAAALRYRHQDLIASPAPHALRLYIGHVKVLSDTVRATVSWSRCTEREAVLNAWTHETTYFLARAGREWRLSSRRVVIGDGHC
jgi:hypothetical protein